MAPLSLTCLIDQFRTMSDPRMPGKIKHDLAEVVSLAICAVVAGAESWEDIETFARARIDWFKTFMRLDHEIPSEQTFARIFSWLDPRSFQKNLLTWFEFLSEASRGKLVDRWHRALVGTKDCRHRRQDSNHWRHRDD